MNELAWGCVEDYDDKMRMLKHGVLLEVEARADKYAHLNLVAFSLRSQMTLSLANVRRTGAMSIDKLREELGEKNTTLAQLHETRREAQMKMSKKLYDGVFGQWSSVPPPP